MSFHSTSRLQRHTSAELPVSSGILQRKCACGQHSATGGACDECREKSQKLQRSATNHTEPGTVHPIVNSVLRSPGRPLDTGTREFMEPRFGHDFSQVRLHTDASAAQSATAVNARAYTVQSDIVFGAGQYQPTSAPGTRLMAHELAHVVQQDQGGNTAEAELRADEAAVRVGNNQAVLPGALGGTSPGLYADNGETEETPTAAPARETRPAFSVGWTDLARIGTFQLTPPSLLAPPPRRLSLGSPLLSSPISPTLSVPGLPPPRLSLPEPTLTSPSSPALTSPSSAPSAETEEESSAPSLPSRLSVLNRGRFSLGLRLGFPKLETPTVPGMPESALAESLRRATLMNQVLTGNVPSGWETVDKGQLAKAVWGIFSTNIAPDLARSITSGLSTPAGPAGVSYELDMVLITDFSSEIGGGLSFTARFPSFESLFTGRQ